MGAGTSRPTTKLDPQDLLGLVALTEGRERLRPTCEMPKIELANLLDDPAMGRAPAPDLVLAKGSSGIAPIPRGVLDDELPSAPHIALWVARCVLAIVTIVVVLVLL